VDTFAFLGFRAVSGALASELSEAEVVIVMTLSLDRALLMVSCEVRFEERRAESAASKSSSVSISGDGEDAGSGDKVVAGVEDGWWAVDGTDTDASALERVDRTGASALSVINLVGGKMFRTGQKDIAVVYCGG
jgi:hypothetical protein